jgi:2-C-methyl-D-erythritol 4-phosphate cytidylyltransferase/2-C-methyl-D-erythritol 2,4-cyclodiphosphate synthase
VSDISLVLLGAGSSSRFKAPVKKQWLYTGESPLWLHVTQQFENVFDFVKIIIVSSEDEIRVMEQFADHTYVVGGSSRQESLSNAMKEVTTPYVLVSDIARCCIDEAMLHRILSAKAEGACIVPAIKAVDTLYYEGNPIDREKVRAVQTPQLSRTDILKQALQTSEAFTDESSAIAALGEKVAFVEGSTKAHKLTTVHDLTKLPCLEAPSSLTLTGFGIDTHPFQKDKTMKLCGVTIDVDYGFKAHSDGDVAIHALIDALLGACGMGDIGELYPDTDNSYANVDSTLLLKDTIQKITSYGFAVRNVDMTIIAQAPKLKPYKMQMRKTLAALLGIRPNVVNIKATTSEELGFIGRKEGVTVHAVANVNYYQWQSLR